MLEWISRDATTPIHYWSFGIGIGGIDRYWYCVVFLFSISFVLVFTTEDFSTTKLLMGRDIDFPQSLPKDCRGRANRILF